MHSENVQNSRTTSKNFFESASRRIFNFSLEKIVKNSQMASKEIFFEGVFKIIFIIYTLENVRNSQTTSNNFFESAFKRIFNSLLKKIF